ncbi:hypothetical protein [Paenibacillus aestuarii]|uniref:Uncharacterized protein n=1 Tax=Paenibacillus aestuarii TaxID=516965 RepID=A0ABW0KA90_9BACL|nr:hypothetical protein [Paenibacillus aestuarii]
MVRIHFKAIHIDDLANSSSVNKGMNRIIGVRHSDKTNQGLGEVKGEHNAAIGGSHLVQDEDTVDFEQPKRRKS